ncbi:hypothetical protein VKT23_013319 [Stygiomarasmius scandens]|uniref:C2H2-type domain-containing protein n=1 Tax=Marasmiellus scandens TaxID=2682957 RepID=A0ABR1J355_9AGAR
MLTVAAVSGLSIVVRSRDPHFSLNNIMFVTEYDGQNTSPTTNSLNVSISKEQDTCGQLIRISFSDLSLSTSRANHLNCLQPSDYSSPPQPLQGLQGNGTDTVFYSGYPSPSSSLADASSLSQNTVGLGSIDSVSVDASFDAVFPDPTHIFHDPPHPIDYQIQTKPSRFSSSSPPPLSQTELFDIPTTSGESSMTSLAHSFSHATLTSDPNCLNGGVQYEAPLQTSSGQFSDPMSRISLDSISYVDPFVDATPNSSASDILSTSMPNSNFVTDDFVTKETQQPSSADPNRTLTCRFPGCTKSFARKYHRQIHESSHKPKLRLPLACRQPDCTAQFGRPHDRMRHEVAKHGVRPQHICEDCGKFFSTQAKLNIHKCDRLPTQRHRYTGLKSRRRA